MNVLKKLVNDERKICFKILKDPSIASFLKYKNLNLHNAYYKILVYHFSKKKIKIIQKKFITKKNISKNIIFNSLEERIIITNLIKFYKIKNIKLTKKIPISRYISNFLLKYLYIILEIILSNDSKKKFNTSILSYNRKSSDKFNHFYYLKKISLNKSYFNLNYFFVLKNFILFKKNFLPFKGGKKTDLSSINKLLIKNILIKHLIELHGPKIVTYFEGDNDVSAIIEEISKQKYIKSVCFQWGNVEKYPKNGFYKIKADYFFAWGEIYKKKILKINPLLKTVICGSPLLKTNTKKDNKNIIFFLQKKNIYLDKEFTDNSVQEFKELIIWVSKNIENYKIIIRPHPSGDSIIRIDEFINNPKIVIHNPKKFSINESLSVSEFFINIDSSSAIEACSSNILPLWVNSSKKNIHEENIEKIRSVRKIKLIGNLNVIKKTLFVLTKNKYKKEKILNKISLIFKNNIKYKGKVSQNFIKKNIMKIYFNLNKNKIPDSFLLKHTTNKDKVDD